MKIAERYINEKKLRTRAVELQPMDNTFEKDIHGYNSLLLKSEMALNYKYTRLDQRVFSFPVLGVIGQLGLANMWNDPFYTCCRYALMEEGYKEIEEGENVLSELVDRVQHAKKIIGTLPTNTQAAARKKLEGLSHLINLLCAGLEIFKDMLRTVSGDSESLDAKYNPTALIWVTNYEQ